VSDISTVFSLLFSITYLYEVTLSAALYNGTNGNRSIILVDFFHRITTKFKRLKSQRFEDWLCLHQVKNGGGVEG
jgi:hypothetical protein